MNPLEFFKKIPLLSERNLTPLIEQLNLARELLINQKQHLYPTILILVDNVVELILYQHALEKIPENGKIERYFMPKLKLAEKDKLLSSESAVSIDHLHHKVRNRVQHERHLFLYGYGYEDIIHPLAIFYHEIACELLHNYATSHDDVLISLHDPLEANLAKGLAASMRVMINSTSDMIDFVQKDLLRNGIELAQKKENVYIFAQAWAQAERIYEEKISRKKKFKHIQKHHIAFFLLTTYESFISEDPIPEWNKLASVLVETKQSHLALQNFFKFLDNTKFLRSGLSDIALELAVLKVFGKQ